MHPHFYAMFTLQISQRSKNFVYQRAPHIIIITYIFTANKKETSKKKETNEEGFFLNSKTKSH